MTESMLTTVDNPYNPFVQFDEWVSFDEGKGYYTLQYLARIAKTSPDLSDEQNSQAIEDAINEILDYNLIGVYQKVSKEDFDSTKNRELSELQVESLKLLEGSDEEQTDVETVEEVD